MVSILYLIFSLACSGFTYLAVRFCPETQGKSLEEMYDFFSALLQNEKEVRASGALELEPVLEREQVQLTLH